MKYFTDDCGYTFTTQNGMVSLDCNIVDVSSASSSHMIRGRHCGKNTTARSQTIVARRSHFEILLTNGF